MLNSRTLRSARENGQVVVFFAILLPVLLALGAIVLDVGNWYVHKRHIQTQVDAAVLASAPDFSGCFHAPLAANVNIATSALAYSGDTLRDPATTNLQVQEPNDVRVVLNGDRYWQSSDGTTDPATGYGLDYGSGVPTKMPCATSSLDAKATDDKAPPLWGLIPLTPSPKTHAKVEIHKVKELNQFLPFAVPEIDPEAVVAIFINDDNGAIVDWQELRENTSYDNDGNSATPYPFSAWTTDPLQKQVCITCNNTSSHTSVVILVSKQDPSPPILATLLATCTQPNLIACYGGSSAGSGLSFINGYQPGQGGPANPIVREVNLVSFGCSSQSDLSAPYFTLEGDCSANVQAAIDVGVSGGTNPTLWPNCVEINGMSWSGNDANDDSLFTGSISLPAASGRQAVNLSGRRTNRNNNNQTCRNNTDVTYSFPNPVAAAYVADDASGPVEYLKLTATTFAPNCVGGTTVLDANSVPKGKDYCYTVAVGLERPLGLLPATTDPLLLRFASKADRKSGNLAQPLTQALDCDKGIKLELELVNGCQTFYALNYDDWDDDPLTPNTWADIRCTQYSPSDLPPPNFVNNPTPICVAPKGGTVQDMQKGLFDRFEDPCTPNYWPEKNATQSEIDDFITNHDFLNDKRYITLIITDNTAFSGPQFNEPVKYFAGFYATGWDKGGPKANGCPNPGGGDNGNDCHPLLSTSQNPSPSRSEPCTSYQKTKDNGDVWGHFVKLVVFSSTANPSDDLCALTSDAPETCVAVLVE